jgi:hypothetical protein
VSEIGPDTCRAIKPENFFKKAKALSDLSFIIY